MKKAREFFTDQWVKVAVVLLVTIFILLSNYIRQKNAAERKQPNNHLARLIVGSDTVDIDCGNVDLSKARGYNHGWNDTVTGIFTIELMEYKDGYLTARDSATYYEQVTHYDMAGVDKKGVPFTIHGSDELPLIMPKLDTSLYRSAKIFTHIVTKKGN